MLQRVRMKRGGLERKFLEKVTIPPRGKRGIRHMSRFVEDFPTGFIVKVIGFNNYREHRIPGIQEFSTSMAEVGLLEPVSLEYNTKTGNWDFIDGEGRVWGALFRNAVTMPAEVYYNLPEEVKLRMKAAANAGKKEIDPADIAVFSQMLYERGQFDREEFRRLMGRAPSTLRAYFTFAGMDPEVRSYVSEHRNEKLFSRATQVGRALPDHQQQRAAFFSMVREGRVNRASFKRGLQARVEELSGRKFELRHQDETQKPGQETLNELFDYVRKSRKYVDAFCLFLDCFPEVRKSLKGYTFEATEGRIEGYVTYLEARFEESLAYMSEQVVETVRRVIALPEERDFRDKARDHLGRRKKREEVRIPAIGRKIEYIPTEEIRDAEQHPRNYNLRGGVNHLPDETLDKEIREEGQIKPGLVEIVDPEYRVVYGQRRLDSVRRAGIPFFKTFVVGELDAVQRGVLQCTENIFEADTAAERAKVLYTQYQLMRMLAEGRSETYTVREFVRDFGHLASDKTLTRAIMFMEQDKIIQDLVRSRIISFGASFEISSVPEEKRFEVLYAAMVLGSRELEERVREIRGSDGQMALFNTEVPRSYVRVFRQFEQSSMAPFAYLDIAMRNSREEVVQRISSNEHLFMHYAKLHRSICQLKDLLGER